jgi:hypothetical protein
MTLHVSKIFTAKNLTRSFLFFLMVWRFLISIASYWSGKSEMSRWEEIAFLCASYSLISIMVWVNKSDLQEINIDKNFISIFIALGAIYSFLVPPVFGFLLGTATIINVGVLLSRKSKYSKSELSNANFMMFLITLLVLDFVYFIVIQRARVIAFEI